MTSENGSLRSGNNEATIYIKSSQDDGGDINSGIEFFTAGTYCLKNGVRYIRYTEPGNGYGGTSMTVKVEDGRRVTVMRHGAQRYRIVLAEGERQHSLYSTDFGELLLGVSGTKIRSDLDENGGTLKLEYMLDVNNTVTSHNTLEIQVKNGGTGFISEEGAKNAGYQQQH